MHNAPYITRHSASAGLVRCPQQVDAWRSLFRFPEMMFPIGKKYPKMFGELAPIGRKSPKMFGELAPAGRRSPKVFGELVPAGRKSPKVLGELAPAGKMFAKGFGCPPCQSVR